MLWAGKHEVSWQGVRDLSAFQQQQDALYGHYKGSGPCQLWLLMIPGCVCSSQKGITGFFLGQILAFQLPKVFLICLVKRMCCTFGLMGSCASHTLKYDGGKKNPSHFLVGTFSCCGRIRGFFELKFIFSKKILKKGSLLLIN